jgi:hypothetical protein
VGFALSNFRGNCGRARRGEAGRLKTNRVPHARSFQEGAVFEGYTITVGDFGPRDKDFRAVKINA